MLQIDHVYEFLYQELFKDFEFWHLYNGVAKSGPINIRDISVFTPHINADKKIFFYDQEPYIPQLVDPYFNIFNENKNTRIIVTSEYSAELSNCVNNTGAHLLYYFFHGFAALDWYRGFYALNYNKSVLTSAKYDFTSFNRLIADDRSYRIYFVSLLKEYDLLKTGLVSFGVTDDSDLSWQDEVSNTASKLSETAKLHIENHLTGVTKLIIDNSHVQGSASAGIPRTINRIDYNNDTPNFDSLWHVVTETVYYYPKLHLTEKIFKPIVSKQPFMLLAAPGNLAYLRNYGFKTFSSVIDESYDNIHDNDARIEAVVKQLHWLCNLSPSEKYELIKEIEPIIEYNFNHFYKDFKYIITDELINNTKTIFTNIGYNDSNIDYVALHHSLTN